MNNSKIKKTLNSILKVALSNVATILSGVIVGFVLPKIIGVTNYGYYKTFSLYITYVGLLQFGISEGIYLKYGGVPYEQLDKEKFRYYSRFFAVLEVSTSLLFCLISLLVFRDDNAFIFSCVALFVMFQNITAYYQFISQITGRFNELSIRNVIKSVLSIAAVGGMWVYYHFNGEIYLSYKIYTVLYIAIFAVLTLWYIFTYRDITFGKSNKPEKQEGIISLVKIGIPLLIANLCSTLTLSIDRQFVSILFDIDTYGSYSFAYNMISLITVATSAIGTVLYPTLKSSNRDLLIKSFEKLVMIFSAFVCLCILVYFPLCKFVNVFFADQTKYIESLPVFRVILPSLVFSCTLAVIIHTYYKTFELNTIYFFIVIGALAMSIAANFVAYYFWSTTEAISFASVIITAIWYFVSVVLLAKKIQIKWLKTGLYMFTMVLIFYIVAFLIDIWWLGLIVYFVSYLIITFIYNYKYIVNKLVRKEIISHENFKANDESFKKESNEKNI